MTILILGSMEDEHACYMLEHLRQLGEDTELMDSSWFPSEMQLAYDPASAAGVIRLPTGRALSFEDIRSVYWRCYNHVGGSDLPDLEQAYIATNDSRGLFESFLIQLPARWVNSWNAFQLHQTKPVQLARVAALGIDTPATLLTNDAESVLEFVAQYRRAIFKPVQGGAHTRRVTREHLSMENLKNLALAPVTLQEEIIGTDIRVFVVDEEIFACEIVTEALDFRDDIEASITPCQLPDQVMNDCVRAARELDLLWTGMDLRRTEEGRYVLLEANPSPMFQGFEERSGLPLTEKLTELLTRD